MSNDDLGDQFISFLVGWKRADANLQTEFDSWLNGPKIDPYEIRSLKSGLLLVLFPPFAGIFFALLASTSAMLGSPWYWGGGAFVLALVGVPSLMAYLRMSMILRSEGVWIIRGKERVFCPWRLFTAPGAPFLRTKTIPSWLVLPIENSSATELEQSRDNTVTANGMAVKTAFFHVLPPHQIEIACAFEFSPEVIGGLLLKAGSQLGAAAGSDSAVRLSIEKNNSPVLSIPNFTQKVKGPLSGIAELLSPGKVRLNVTQIAFPSTCCGCGEETTEHLKFKIPTRMLLVLGTGEFLKTSIPCCAKCSRIDYLSRWGGILLMQSSIILTLALIIFLILPNLFDWTSLLVCAIVSLIFIKISFRVGDKLSGIVRGIYYPNARNVMLKFKRREYANEILNFISSNR